MITSDEIKVVDNGNNYTIGEIRETHPHLRYLKRGALVTLFDGVDTALDFVTDKMPEPKRSGSSDNEGNGRFNTFSSYKEAMDIFRNKPEQVVKFDASELRIKDVGESGSEVEFDVTGDYIDMGRYMEGIPEVMGTMHNGNARNRRANIVINLSYSGSTDQSIVLHRSERLLRLIDALEAGGVRSMLTAIESSQTSHLEIVVKQHDEPLTITDLAVVTHPEFLRRPVFRIIEHSKTFEWGYGSSILFSRALTPEIIEGGNNSELDIIIDGNLRSKDSVDKGFDQLEKLLVWEMSKPVTEVSSIKLDDKGIWFNPNGARSESEIKREGMEIINE